MNTQFKRMSIVISALLSTVAFSTPASADTMLGTGDYNRELHTMA
ncbi:MAG TPA: hypothetical protein PKW44_07495 [Methylophilaceae bacterium]|nr:hypothetical protein [Methylophilaceae bacterium]